MKSALKSDSALGVVVVLYKSDDVIEACLRSLLAQRPHVGRIVLVDNCCPTDSVSVVRRVASQVGASISVNDASEITDNATCQASVEVIRSKQNLGYAGGANLGLKALLCDPNVNYFWILNPDCELTTNCALQVVGTALKSSSEGGFALLGTRVLYHDADRTIQSDGGICCSWTGRCRNINQGILASTSPSTFSSKMNFISGASMIASRSFIDEAGLMPESYFLYYEEVAWARARRKLPLVMCHDANVLHHGGTAIGSGAHNRAASPLSHYFNFRNRMRFVAKFHTLSLPVSYAFSLLKIIQMLRRGYWGAAVAAFRGTHGMSPSRQVRDAFKKSERSRAFASGHEKHRSVSLQDQRTPV